jgi:hypothetical protein
MNIEKIKSIVEEVVPKLVRKYGHSKFADTLPYVEYEKNVFSEEEVLTSEDKKDCPYGEYDTIDNSIVIYYPKMKTKEQLVKTLIHEYQHYLQSPSWMTRYYNMGYGYNDHPYEVAARREEINWKNL